MPAPLPDLTIAELRQYTLHPGRRDELIELFERELVETQDAVGAFVLGQFRDLDDADRFVWLRGFADMNSRLDSLATFYGGPVWAAHRNDANATMIDSDDVLLLRPLVVGTTRELIRDDDSAAKPSRVAVAVLTFDTPSDDRRIDALLAAIVSSALDGIATAAAFETEHAENTFPALPVRIGEHVLVWVTRFDDADALDESIAVLESAIAPLRARSVRWLRLQPTGRSAIC